MRRALPLCWITLGLAAGWGCAAWDDPRADPCYAEVVRTSPAGREVSFLSQADRHYPEVVRDCLALIDRLDAPRRLRIHVWQAGSFPTRISSSGFAVETLDCDTGTCWLSVWKQTGGTLLPGLEHLIVHEQHPGWAHDEQRFEDAEAALRGLR